MTPADLAAYALAELASREKHYPAMIAEGAIEAAAAEADLAAWRGIEAITRFSAERKPGGYRENPRLATTAVAGEGATWDEMVAATSRALDRQRRRDPASGRCAAVQALHDHVVDRRWFWTGDAAPRPALPAEPLSEAA
ncbi:MAG: hypothetical protein AB7O91_03915 [Sphingomonas sp.]